MGHRLESKECGVCLHDTANKNGRKPAEKRGTKRQGADVSGRRADNQERIEAKDINITSLISLGGYEEDQPEYYIRSIIRRVRR